MHPWTRTVALVTGSCALLLASCGDPPPPPATVDSPVFSPLPGTNTFALAVPRGTAKDRFPELARKHCADRSPCAVYAWVAPDEAAKTLPLTERQALTQAYSYIANRVTGFELSLWNCRMYVRDDPDECMPDLEDGP